MTSAYESHTRKKRKPTFSKIQDPKGCHPIVTLLYSEMKRRIIRSEDIVERSGLTTHTIKAWRHATNPTLLSAEAALGAVNYSLVAVPNEKAIPEHIATELRPIATKLGMEMPEAVRLASLIMYRDHHYGTISAPH